MSETEKHYFSRITTPEESVFPIDYTESDFVDTILETTKNNTHTKPRVKSHLTGSQWYIDFNNQLLFYDCNPHIIEEQMAGITNIVRTIPVEAFHLLSSFVCRSINKGSPSKANQKESLHNSIIETFIDLHDGIQKGEIDNPLLTHTLYADESFSRTIANHFWLNEISSRHKQVTDLANQCEISVQIEVLQSLIQALDSAMSKLQNSITQDILPPEHYSIDNALLPLLYKLTEYREKAPQLRQNLITYNIEDLNIQYHPSPSHPTASISMKDAFNLLTKKNRRNKELLENTRNSYLHNLATKVDASDFENKINALTSYIGIFSLSTSEIRDLVESEYRTYLKGIIDHIHFEPNNLYNSTDSSTSRNHLLEDLIEAEIKPKIAKISFEFNDVIRIISHFNSMKAYLEIDGCSSFDDIVIRIDEDTSRLKDATPEEKRSMLQKKLHNYKHTKEDALFCCQLICAMWHHAFEGNHLLPQYDSTVSTEHFINSFKYSIHTNNTKIALLLLQKHRKAERFFEYPTRHKNMYADLQNYKRVLNYINAILCAPNGMPYDTLIHFGTPLLDDLFCIVLESTATSSIKPLTDKILQLKELYNSRHS